MKIDNHEEYEEAEGWLSEAESVAKRIWEKFHSTPPPDKFRLSRWGTPAGGVWDLTRAIVEDLTGRDPDEIIEAMEDFLARYPESDPAAEAKAYAEAMEV